MISNLEYYKVFYQVAKLGRITNAAQSLNISQPAVSQSVKQLENQLGTKLFARTSKGVRLTKEGELLFSYVEKGYEQFELGEQKLARMMNLEVGELRIGASDMTLRFFLLPYLEKFHELHPNIKVIVTNAPTPETIQYLQHGKIDFGVVSTPFEEDDHIQSIPVMKIEDTFVCGRKFIQYKNKTLDFKALENLPLITLEGNTSSKTYMEEFLQKHGVTMHPEFELATSDMIVQFALRNLGVGVVMKNFVKEELESGRLFELRFNKMIPKRNFCIVTDKRSSMTAAAESLLDIIQTEHKHRNKGKEE